MLRGGINLPWPLTHIIDFSDTAVGSLCFYAEHQTNNKTIRAIFQKEIVTIPYILPYWNGLIVFLGSLVFVFQIHAY